MSEETLFAQALEKPVGVERDAFLDVACGGDGALRERVERLLTADGKGRGILERGPAAITLDDPHALAVDRVFDDRFKLRQKLGEGGMGEVWVADQTHPVQRRVALKVIRAGHAAARLVARFDQERQALALMDHPHIARVLDAGVADGRPYFVMELIKGVPITEYCDTARLPPRERLELFLPVCLAVQHAHQKGVIHRDLKPSNILVGLADGRPVPKVIDFGVAKATGPRLTEQSIYTEVGSLIGTLEYMSPEQAELNNLDVDTRSDVYSLGVLLYELLVGSPPFTRKDLETVGFLETLRVIREQEPTRPSRKLSTAESLPALATNRGTEPAKLTKLLRGELDWIVLKALEKDRNLRYGTANALAFDVQRYLADEPVLACPPAARYRLWKSVRRNKVIVTATLLVTASLVIGTAASIWQAALARRAEADAAQRLVRETQARQQTDAINQLLAEGLAAANPDSARGTDFTVRQLLDEISSRLGDRLSDQPAAEATIRATIGNAYFRLGLPDKAALHLRRAQELREQQYGSDSPEVARGLYDEAFNLQEYGDVPGAFERVNRALAIHRKAGLRDIVTVRILWLLQLIHQRRNRDDLSEQVGREALVIARQLADAGPEMANILHTLATNVLRQRRDFVESEKLTRESIALHRKFHGDNHPQTARALALLGVLLAENGKFVEAEPHLREAMAVFSNSFGYISEGEVPALHYLVVTLRGKKDNAGLESLRTDVTARAKRIREERPGAVGPLFYAALALAIVDDADGAVEILSQIATKKPGKLRVWYGRIDHLAILLANRPDSHRRYPGVALGLAQQAVELAPRDGEVWATLGVAQYRASNWRDAVQALDKSLELQSRRNVTSWLFLAMAHWQLGEEEKARRWYDLADQWIDKNRPTDEQLRILHSEAENLMKGSKPLRSGRRGNSTYA
jgi:serine/threonine protein kinase/Flp pilus assembly protein TadD